MPKLPIGQSEAMSIVLISCNIYKITEWPDVATILLVQLAEYRYNEYQFVSFWYSSVVYNYNLDTPWVFWLNSVSQDTNHGFTELTGYAILQMFD